MIHPLTNIHPGAKIGTAVTIDEFSSIAEDVEIGDGTWIGSNVSIMNGARIGKNCKIFPGAVISADPQDLKFAGEKIDCLSQQLSILAVSFNVSILLLILKFKA